MCAGHRHLFIVPGGLTPAPEDGYWELSLCESCIRHYQGTGTVMTTKEIAVEIAERFLEKHAQVKAAAKE